MNCPLARRMALLLIPCLIVDPSTASAFSTLPTPPLVHSIQIQNVFQEEALELAVVGARSFCSLKTSVSSRIQRSAAGLVILLATPLFLGDLHGKIWMTVSFLIGALVFGRSGHGDTGNGGAEGHFIYARVRPRE